MMKKEYQELQMDLLLLLVKDVLTFSFEENAEDDIFKNGEEDSVKW